MTEKSALDRYAEARRDLDWTRESVIATADLLSRVSQALRQRPITLPVEGIGERSQIRTHPDLLKKDDWPDFDSIKGLITRAQEAEQKEQEIYQRLSRHEQAIVKRG